VRILARLPEPDFRFPLLAIAGNLPGAGALKKLGGAVRRKS
jgi:hypothetical protein